MPENVSVVDPILMEMTGAQSVSSYGETLVNPLPMSYTTYRTMRKDPTIALARAISLAPILSSEWSINAEEEVSEETRERIKEDIIPLHRIYLETVLNGGMDFGWGGFEKLFKLDTEGFLRITKLKPLLPDKTDILVNTSSGAYVGYRQGTIDLPVEKCLHVPFRVEGTNWYGVSQLENVRETYNEWREANAGAARYDAKQAGSHWVVYFPPGKTLQGDEEVDNRTIASEILAALRSSGSVAVPNSILEARDELGDVVPGWKIELLSDSGGKQPTFISRLKYLDGLKVRGLILPERAILEGQFGTKAEASVHADQSLLYRELQHRYVLDFMNWHVVDQLMTYNHGEEARGTVTIVPEPLTDEEKAWYKELYFKLLSNPTTLALEYANLDREALYEKLGVPATVEDNFGLIDIQDDGDLDDEDE